MGDTCKRLANISVLGLFTPCNGLQDDGATWPAPGDVDISLKTPNDEGDTSKAAISDDVAEARLVGTLLSRCMLHIARAANRASWGRSWTKVGDSSEGSACLKCVATI